MSSPPAFPARIGAFPFLPSESSPERPSPRPKGRALHRRGRHRHPDEVSVGMTPAIVDRAPRIRLISFLPRRIAALWDHAVRRNEQAIRRGRSFFKLRVRPAEFSAQAGFDSPIEASGRGRSELRAPSRERETERTDPPAPAARCAVVCHRREGHQLGRCAQFQPGEGRRDQLLDQQDPERSSGSNRKLQMRTPQGAGAAAAAGGAGASPAGAEGGVGCGGRSWGGMS